MARRSSRSICTPRRAATRSSTQLYNFVDKGGRDVALRPEMTPTFARMVGARAQALRKPVRWFSMPQLFRYERTQKGRLREHFQLNVDIVGESDVLADAELLAVAIDIMRALGLTAADVRARVSVIAGCSTPCWQHLGIAERRVAGGIRACSTSSSVSRARCRPRSSPSAGVDRRGAETVLGFATLDFETLRAHVRRVRRRRAARRRVSPSISRMRRRWGSREWIRFDLTIVRGLAYYTGIVFELFDARGGVPRDLRRGALRQPAGVAGRRGPPGAGLRHG